MYRPGGKWRVSGVKFIQRCVRLAVLLMCLDAFNDSVELSSRSSIFRPRIGPLLSQSKGFLETFCVGAPEAGRSRPDRQVSPRQICPVLTHPPSQSRAAADSASPESLVARVSTRAGRSR